MVDYGKLIDEEKARRLRQEWCAASGHPIRQGRRVNTSFGLTRNLAARLLRYK